MVSTVHRSADLSVGWGTTSPVICTCSRASLIDFVRIPPESALRQKNNAPSFRGSDTLRIATLPLLPDGVRSFASAPVCAHGIARRRLRRLHHARIPARAQPSHGHHCSHANNNLSLKGVKQRLESCGWPSPTGWRICGRPGDATGHAPPSQRSSAAQLVRWAAGYPMNT